MKGWIVILFLILIILIVSFIPVTKSVSLKINAPYFNVYQYLALAHNWKKWQPLLKDQADDKHEKVDSNKTGFKITSSKTSFEVKNLGFNNFSVSKTENGKEYNFEYILIPKIKANKTEVIIIHKISLFKYLLSIFNNDDLIESPILDLKRYMENVNLYYGFTIYKQKTQERIIAVRQESSTVKLKYDQSRLMLQQLETFINQNQLKTTYPLQYQVIPFKADSLQILLGYPVDKQIKTTEDIKYMDMPRGNTLVGLYKGRYNLRYKLYDAMNLYMQDNYTRQLIRPYEKFAGNKLPDNDTVTVDMQVVIPVY